MGLLVALALVRCALIIRNKCNLVDLTHLRKGNFGKGKGKHGQSEKLREKEEGKRVGCKGTAGSCKVNFNQQANTKQTLGATPKTPLPRRLSVPRVHLSPVQETARISSITLDELQYVEMVCVLRLLAMSYYCTPHAAGCYPVYCL